MAHKPVTDVELDQMLSLASNPEVPADFATKIATKIQPPVEASAEILLFKPRVQSVPPQRWLMAVPLAASLVLGVWLGAAGKGTSFLWSATTELTASSDDIGASTGIDDAETLSDEGVT